MAVETVQDAFVEFEKKAVRVTPAENDRAKDVHPTIRDAVEKALGDLLAQSFLAGSYARKVQTVTLHDIDVIIVLNDPDGTFAASADAALERIREAAKECEIVAGTRKGVRAVKLTIDGEQFTVDLVAALEDPFGELKLARRKPEDGYDDWTPARPRGQTDAHWQKNKDTDGAFVPAVRIIKYWNQRKRHNGKNALPSYLAESILFHAITGKCDFADAVVMFFRAAQMHLSSSFPTVTCPGDPANYVDAMLDDDRRQTALDKVTVALEQAEDAAAEEDPKTAMDLWVKVFGPAFPAPSGDTSQLATALRSGTAVAKGAAISTDPEGGRQVIESRPWRTE